MTLSLVYDLLILLTAGLAAALICRRLSVSVLIGYLLVGTVIGHGVLGWVQDEEHQLAHFAEVGVFLLLFSIGLEFSIDDLKRLGSNFVIGGGSQMLMVAGPVTGVLLWLGLAWQPALLIASAVAFSSTVLVFRARNGIRPFAETAWSSSDRDSVVSGCRAGAFAVNGASA